MATSEVQVPVGVTLEDGPRAARRAGRRAVVGRAVAGRVVAGRAGVVVALPEERRDDVRKTYTPLVARDIAGVLPVVERLAVPIVPVAPRARRGERSPLGCPSLRGEIADRGAV